MSFCLAHVAISVCRIDQLVVQLEQSVGCVFVCPGKNFRTKRRWFNSTLSTYIIFEGQGHS